MTVTLGVPGPEPVTVDATQLQEIVEQVWSCFAQADDDQVPGGQADGAGAERSRPDPSATDLHVVVGISGACTGTLLLVSPLTDAADAAQVMFGGPAGAPDDDQIADAVGELANIVGGGLKSLLPGPSALSIPRVSQGPPPTPAGRCLVEAALPRHRRRVTVSFWSS